MVRRTATSLAPMLRFGLRTVLRATVMRSFIRVPFVLLLVVAAFSWRSVFRRGVTQAPLVDEDASLLDAEDASLFDAEDASLLDAEALNATLYNLTDAEAGGVELQQEVLDLMGGRLESDYAAGGQSHIISIWRSMRYAGSRPGLLARLRFPARPEHPDRGRLFQEFRWRLSDWFLDSRGLQPEVMSELIERIKRPIDRHYGYPHTGRPYATCAVVGNSGVLLKSAHGRLIDGHDLVIRLNNARTAGYQQHVGSKTTISFINSSILHSCAMRLGCYCNPYGRFVPIVVYICQPAHFLDYLNLQFHPQVPAARHRRRVRHPLHPHRQVLLVEEIRRGHRKAPHVVGQVPRREAVPLLVRDAGRHARVGHLQEGERLRVRQVGGCESPLPHQPDGGAERARLRGGVRFLQRSGRAAAGDTVPENHQN
ncbi:unnamed protein product [Musa hybrid cultivar]